MTGWFEVDKGGLAKLVERRGKGVALLELLQNAWDAPGVKTVAVTIGHGSVTVEDDSPTGFVNLEEAYTLFAPSKKVGNPELRGRFNFGEKLAFALADKVVIASTTGMVCFNKRGRYQQDGPTGRLRGTVVTLFLAMTPGEKALIVAQARQCIPPTHIVTTINGMRLGGDGPAHTVRTDLQTAQADEGGILRLVTREAQVDFLPTNGAWLFEMGIPVVKLGRDEPFSVNVHQKIPLTMERDNVRPAYLKRIRELVLEHMGTEIRGDLASRRAAGHAEGELMSLPRACSAESHAALCADPDRMMAECAYIGIQRLDDEPDLYLWNCPRCHSTLTGPPPSKKTTPSEGG